MDEKDNLNQEQDSNSTPSNLPIEVKENKFKSLIEDIKDPMFSWKLRESFRDFTDMVSMSAVGQTFRKAILSVSGTISNFTNKIKEVSENKKNKEFGKDGIRVSAIETQAPSKNEVIMPQSAQKTAKEAPSTIIMASTSVQTKNTIINNSKSANDIAIETAENGLKLENLEIDESAISKTAEQDVVKDTIPNSVEKNTVSNSIEAGEISFGKQSQIESSKNKEDR